MNYTTLQIASMLGGTVEGNTLASINKLSKIEESEPGSLSFLANPKYAPHIYNSAATAVIVSKEFVAESEVKPVLIRVDNPYQAFAKMLGLFNPKSTKTGIDKNASVADSALIGKDVYIGAFVSIGEFAVIADNTEIHPNTTIGDHCEIGKGTVIYSGVNIYRSCLVGDACTIHSGVVIGSDGFGFAPSSGKYDKVPQIGNVIIEDHVEIGSNTTIDRATVGSTIIRKGVKLDNLIQIAHNVEIGENTVIAAQTGVAGSTKIGKNCMIGGQVGIVGHIQIADNVKIAAQSGIGASITRDGEVLQGSPAFNIGEYKRSYVLFKKLPELYNRLRDAEKNIGEMKDSLL